MSQIDSAFDDAYRSYRIQAGDDARALPNPYARPVPEQSAGGFVVDNDAGGGSLPDEEAEPARPNTIPLASVPEALTNLGLDASDAHVLSIFADVAFTPASAARRREKPAKVIGREEFRQVAAVLLDEHATSAKRPRSATPASEASGSAARRPKRKAAIKGREKAQELGQEDGGGGGFIVDDDADDSADDFGATRRDEASDSGEEEVASGANRRRQRTRTARSSPSSAEEEYEDEGASATKPARKSKKADAQGGIRSMAYLNPLQRESALQLYEMLLDRLPSKTAFSSAQRRVGVAELQQVLRSLNEKLPEKEVEEMLEEGAKLFAPASAANEPAAGEQAQRKSVQAIKGLDSAQGIQGASVGLDEFAGILVHNRLL